MSRLEKNVWARLNPLFNLPFSSIRKILATPMHTRDGVYATDHSTMAYKRRRDAGVRLTDEGGHGSSAVAERGFSGAGPVRPDGPDVQAADHAGFCYLEHRLKARRQPQAPNGRARRVVRLSTLSEGHGSTGRRGRGRVPQVRQNDRRNQRGDASAADVRPPTMASSPVVSAHGTWSATHTCCSVEKENKFLPVQTKFMNTSLKWILIDVKIYPNRYRSWQTNKLKK